MHDGTVRAIVVGVDGSADSAAATLWAAAEAQRRGDALCLVHAYPVPSIDAGSHGRHHLTETLLTSVAARVSGHAHSPVVVIRTDPTGRLTDGGEGPVVVGLDGSKESDDGLAFALQAAATRRTSLVALRAWDDTDGFPPLIEKRQVDASQAQLLADQLQPWTDKYPEVPVHQQVLRGRPASALHRFCEQDGSMGRPCLLVVGSKGRGGFAGMVPGSTSHALIARATFGVAVVRPEQAA